VGEKLIVLFFSLQAKTEPFYTLGEAWRLLSYLLNLVMVCNLTRSMAMQCYAKAVLGCAKLSHNGVGMSQCSAGQC